MICFTKIVKRFVGIAALLAFYFISNAAFAQQDYYYWYRVTYKGVSTVYGYDKNSATTKKTEAHNKYNEYYKDYQDEHAAWQEKMDDYNARNEAIAEQQKRYSEYQKNVAAWEKATGESGVGVTLDRNSFHLDDATGAKCSIITQLTAAVEVPSFSDITTYRDYCKSYVLTNGTVGGKLDCDNIYRDDSSGECKITFTHEGQNYIEYWASGDGLYSRDQEMWGPDYGDKVSITRTVSPQHISGGYASGVYPFQDKISGISDECEKNSVVLIGTYYHPICINGPVFIDGDVIIRGFVKGQGSIYAGRNIHIIGDISYYDPPSWPHSTDALKKEENQPDAVKKRNKTKDLLLLAARGNIVVGDYTSKEWTNGTQAVYLNLSSKDLKTHTTSEPDIGYTSGYPKNRNYMEVDGGKTVDGLTVTIGGDTYGHVPGALLKKYYYPKTFDYNLKVRERKYYEASIGSVAIQGLKQTTAVDGSKPGWRNSSRLWKRFLALFGWYEFDSSVSVNTDSGDVTEIDAILYANHGIFGVAGGSTLNKLHLNGAMICKDEGLLTSFAGRFSNNSAARAWINWDMRIKSDTDSGIHIGAPEKSEDATTIRVKRVTWSAE